MWYCTYDYEHEKDEKTYKERSGSKYNEEEERNMTYHLRHPDLYKIGIDRECFSLKILGGYILYSMFQCYMVYNFTYVGLNHY